MTLRYGHLTDGLRTFAAPAEASNGIMKRAVIDVWDEHGERIATEFIELNDDNLLDCAASLKEFEDTLQNRYGSGCVFKYRERRPLKKGPQRSGLAG